MPNTILHKRGTTTPAAGSLVTGELAINTATGSVFTKTDAGTVVNIAASGSASWGGISGTLSAQTDLNNALGLKADLAGATFTGKVNTAAPTTGSAFFSLPPGATPSAPINGDMWTTNSGLFTRINGATRNSAFTNTGNTYSAGAKQTVSHAATIAGLCVAPVAGDPTTLSNGDIWHNSTTNQLLARVNGANNQLNAVKAWVNFDGGSTGTWPGGTSTVSRTAGSTTATVTTTTAHGLTTGNTVNALTGVAAGIYTVTVLTTTTFTITTVATTALTAASITFAVTTIRASFNVSSITDIAVGQYRVNFATPMPDINYVAVASAIGSDFGNPGAGPLTNVGNANNTSSPTPTTTSVAIGCWANNDGVGRDAQYIHVVIFR